MSLERQKRCTEFEEYAEFAYNFFIKRIKLRNLRNFNRPSQTAGEHYTWYNPCVAVATVSDLVETMTLYSRHGLLRWMKSYSINLITVLTVLVTATVWDSEGCVLHVVTVINRKMTRVKVSYNFVNYILYCAVSIV